jgi:hypothetical protein
MTIPALFQMWEVPSPSELQILSYEAGGSPEVGLSQWRLDLPEDDTAAESHIKQLESEILSIREVLEKVPLQIERLGSLRLKTLSGELSFDQQEVPAADAEFYALLNVAAPTSERTSFDTASGSRVEWQKAAQEFKISVDRIKTMLTQFANVETSVQGRIIGRTIVSWSGKFETSWHPSRGQNDSRLHQRSLEAALASRRLLINLLIVSTQSAAKLSVLLAVPGGPIVVLPAIWKYVTRMINEIEKYQNLTKQGVQ